MFEVFHVTPQVTQRTLEKFGRGRSVTRVHVVIEEAFAPGAQLFVGTQDHPEAVLGAGDTDLSRTDMQYVNQIVYRLEDILRLQLRAVTPLMQGHAVVYLEGC